MKRSEINSIMREALTFLEESRFYLPPFAFWSPESWRSKGPDCADIVEQQLGWDITDFGGGDFAKMGLFLFTIRNGSPASQEDPMAKSYAEKVLIVEPDQITPTHFHFFKMEDIINRGGGELCIQLWNSNEAKQLADSGVSVKVDGITREFEPGGILRLQPGESVCLHQFLYHKFWAEGSRVLVGEVSRVNDDRTDNHFLEPLGRFPEIEEDEAPLHLLTTDYTNFYTAT